MLPAREHIAVLELHLLGLAKIKIFVHGTLIATIITTTGYLLMWRSNVVAVDDVPDAHLKEGSTDNALEDTVVLHDDFDWMAAFQA